MSTTLEELRKNPDTGLLLDAIREWEAARRSNAFSAAQRERLRNPRLEFHLEPAGGDVRPTGERQWRLYPFHDSAPFRHEAAIRQPGEPTGATWVVENPDEAQVLQFRLRAVGASGAASRFRLEIDHAQAIELDAQLQAGESLVFDGGAAARIYDAKGRQTATVALVKAAPRLTQGPHAIAFNCVFTSDPSPAIEATFRTRGAAEPVGNR